MTEREEPTNDLGPDPEPAVLSGPPAARRSRRLSPMRMAAAVVVLGAVGIGSTQITVQRRETEARRSSQWFAPYIDVTLPPSLNFQDPLVNPNMDVVLAFVVASKTDPCEPSWGASYDLDTAASELDLDRRIVRHRQRGGDVVVSFGGVANDELASSCTDPEELAKAYRSVVDRYHLRVIDLDLEGKGLDPDASSRRATAIAKVQAEKQAAGVDLDVWVTLPVAPQGLQPTSVDAIDHLISAKVDLAGVNIMAMEYGASRPPDVDFADASLTAIDATAAQVRSAYGRNGTTLSLADSYAKVGLTPMIGQNGYPEDRLDTDGARRLAAESRKRGITRYSMWSLNRDAPCAGNVDPAIADNSCSGVDQEPLEFSAIFGSVGGRAASESVDEDREDVTRAARAPEPGSSGTGPHDDWRPRREYDQAAKIVWRGQVYEAKWWNVAAQPDAPVEHEWDSPWRILGPVLADEGPRPTVEAIPDGIYESWAPRIPYEPGDRIEHVGVAYRAKWWTRGDDPTADVDNAWENPWESLDPSSLPTEPATAPNGSSD